MPRRVAAATMTIGALLARIQPEFPDVTVSKVRFLEAEGLLSPGRTPSGYRTYTETDAERLRFILTAQRDRFWPLKVIRDALDAMDRGLEPPGDGPTARAAVPAVTVDDAVPQADALRPRTTRLRLTAAEVADSASIDPETVDALVKFGLITADPDGHFSAHALGVAAAAARLIGWGLEARHLRTFRTAADREAGLIDQVTAATPDRAVAREGFLRDAIALHVALVRAGLADAE